MKIPHPIPYQGSKRNLADKILRYFPGRVDRLVEPFAGSAAISIAAAWYYKAEKFLLNDINAPLIELWDEIINRPQTIIRKYHETWLHQSGQDEEHFYEIREQFNASAKAEHLLYLLARCVKAAVRYNANGDFNQSPDKRRKGRTPANMREDILRVSELFKGRIELSSVDYQEVLRGITVKDLVYLDPPYQGTGINKGFRYKEDVNYDDFVVALFDLKKRNIPFLLSYDGRTGEKIFGKALPVNLNLTKIEIDAGRSSIATLHNRIENTFEALYLSEALINLLDANVLQLNHAHQLMLFAE